MDRLESKQKTSNIVASAEPLLPFEFEADDKQLSPELDRARFAMQQGSYEIAYNQFKHLEADEVLAEQSAVLTAHVFACLKNLGNIFLIESLADLRDDIIRFRAQEHEDGSSIRRLCVRLIQFKYNDNEQAYSLQQIAEDDFLLDCLANDYYPDPEIEKFLTDIRRQLLLSSVQDMEISESCLALYQALALQGYLTDYVFFVRDDEQQVVDTLNEELANVLSAEECELDDVVNIMLLLSMYTPLIKTNAFPALQGLQADQIPEYLQTIYSLTYLEPQDIQAKAAEVLALGNVNPQSKQVQKQYERSPYPRYSRLQFSPSPVSYRARSPHLADSDLNLDVLDSNPLEILVAGCGTGSHPLQIAKSCRGAKVTAIDISRTSLAFAERLRSAYGVTNTQFYQADILELPQIFQGNRQRFHVVECIGVLHHMPDLEAGLAALTAVLVPGGILHLGLYSALARAKITEIRSLNEKIGMRPTNTNIRHFRRQLMTSRLDNSIKTLLYSLDFHNLHGCRDLLFNTQETSLTIPALKQLLQSQNLEFLGFNFRDGSAMAKYREMFPADELQRNLDYWHQLEQLHPNTFQQMYRLHCQKPG